MNQFYITHDAKAYGETDNAPSVAVKKSSLVKTWREASGYVSWKKPENPSIADRVAHTLSGGKKFARIPDEVRVSLAGGAALNLPFSHDEFLQINLAAQQRGEIADFRRQNWDNLRAGLKRGPA